MNRRQATSFLFLLWMGVTIGYMFGSPSIAETKSQAGGPDLEFEEVSREVGFTYNTTDRSGIISDAGVYVTDYNVDGWPDLLAIGGSEPVLFRNDGGTYNPSGQLEGINQSIRVAIFLDYDADGDDDLLLFTWDGTPVVLTNQEGNLERTDGVLDARFERPVGATAGDYNGDGCVDIFVIQNGDWTDRLPRGHETPDVAPGEDNGNLNLLFEGSCGSFRNATASAGIHGSAWSLATSMVDLDGDSRPDIHVANDFNNDVVYWNSRDGTFTREILPEETNRNSMASEAEDFSGNGRLDLFVTNIYFPKNGSGDVVYVADGRTDGNTLLVNEGDRRLSPRGKHCGVRNGGWGWATVGEDLDNDGDTDILHTTLEFTGYLGRELLQLRERSPHYSYPVVFERQSGSECQFVTANASAIGFEETDGHGVAQLDFDRDGNVDIALAESPGPTGDARFRLYENVGETGRALQVQIRGQPSLGTRIILDSPGDKQVRVLHSRTDYFSQDSRIVHFGMGNHSEADLRVVWPDGVEATFTDVEAGKRLVLSRDGIERKIVLDGSPARALTIPTLLVLLVLVPILAAGIVLLYRYRMGQHVS